MTKKKTARREPKRANVGKTANQHLSSCRNVLLCHRERICLIRIKKDIADPGQISAG